MKAQGIHLFYLCIYFRFMVLAQGYEITKNV